MYSKHKIGRNDPCPCGSGKKYKKCCGALVSTQSTIKLEPDYFKMNKEIAYKGRIGQERRDFCVRFIERKKERIQELIKIQSEATSSKGEIISCKRGCCFCCSAYVETTLQECEAIVYYLYQNNQIFESFIKKYPHWREQIRRNGDLFKSCGQFWKEKVTPETAHDFMLAISAEEERYMQQNIPCPFLDNQLCSIYEVRPYSCVSCIAVSPSEWCNPKSPNEPELRKVYPIDFLRDMMTDYSFYYQNLDKFVITFMPLAVYEILKSGVSYFSMGGIPGLEKLDSEFLTDPEVKPIFLRYGFG